MDKHTRTEMESRRELVEALRSVAALEHRVMCEYLFAALSLKKWPSEGGVTPADLERIREWQSTLLLVARQEMEHLGIVSNLLSSIGEKPYFGFADRSGNDRPDLRPFSISVLEHFVEIEEAHDPPPPTGDGSVARTQGQESIGALYARIQRGFRELDDKLDNLFVGFGAAQVANADIDLRPGLYHINLKTVSDLDSAEAALDHILGASHGHDESHAERFRRVLAEVREMEARVPGFKSARPVASNPSTRGSPGRPGCTIIEDTVTRAAMDLFSDAYETMLLILGRFYSPSYESAEERHTLKRVVFFPMMTMVVRPLAELLTRMPVGPESRLTAGGGFEFDEPLDLYPEKRTAWLTLHGRFRRLASRAQKVCADVCDRDDLNRGELPERFRFLQQNLEALAARFESGMNLKYEYLQYLLRKAL